MTCDLCVRWFHADRIAWHLLRCHDIPLERLGDSSPVIIDSTRRRL